MYISECEIFNPVLPLVFQSELKRKRFKKEAVTAPLGMIDMRESTVRGIWKDLE